MQEVSLPPNPSLFKNIPTTLRPIQEQIFVCELDGAQWEFLFGNGVILEVSFIMLVQTQNIS